MARVLPARLLPIEPLWFEWLALVGMFIFASRLLGVQGVWLLLFRSDPTGITLVIRFCRINRQAVSSSMLSTFVKEVWTRCWISKECASRST